MDPDHLKILSEELRETRNMVVEIRNMVAETRLIAEAAQKTAEAAQKSADAAQKSADAAQRFAVAAEKGMEAKANRTEAVWELVIMTRNRIEEDLRLLRLPWWKKLVGRTA
jgi:hypothetical protein